MNDRTDQRRTDRQIFFEKYYVRFVISRFLWRMIALFTYEDRLSATILQFLFNILIQEKCILR